MIIDDKDNDEVIARRLNALDALLQAFMQENNLSAGDVELVETMKYIDDGVEHSWYVRRRTSADTIVLDGDSER